MTEERVVVLVAAVIHEVEMNRWPEISAHPRGDCLGGDRCEFVAQAVVALVEPLIRRRVAEEIAAAAEEEADELDMPIAMEWFQLRSWFQGRLHAVAAKAYAIGGVA